MPQKVLNFTGINRKVNEFYSQGACEELINIRPSVGGGHKLVKPKATAKDNFDYVLFYEHIYGDVNNQIGVKSDGTVDWINPQDSPAKTIIKFSSSNVSISHVNNVVVLYNYDDNTQSAFKFKDGEYSKYYAAPVNMKAWIDFRSTSGAPVFVASQGHALYDSGSFNTEAWEEALANAMSKFQIDHSGGLCGASIIGCTYELEDGEEVWASAFVVADSDKARENNSTRFPTTPLCGVTQNNLSSVVVIGVDNVTYCLSWKGELEGIRKIKVYATRPASQYKFVQDSNSTVAKAQKVSLDTLGLDGKIMYFIGSMDATKNQNAMSLDFSPDKFAGDTMPVTSGAVERVGPSVSLNNRFHYFKSELNHTIQSPTLSEQVAVIASFSPWIAYVKFDDGWKLIDNVYSFYENDTHDFIYPYAGVKQIAFMRCEYLNGNKLTPLYDDMFFVNMKDSKSYNYSYAFDVTPNVVPVADDWLDVVDEAGEGWAQIQSKGYTKMVSIKKETNAINVTVPRNPYAFDITASYSFGGEIKEIVTSYIPISAVQVNQFPITVFTTNGIYALEQGTGEVLYQGVDPLQPLVVDGKPISTPHGIFFFSAKNLYVMLGEHVADVSGALSAKVDKDLRSLSAYKTLCNNTRGVFNNFTSALSEPDFQTYIDGASLIYDQLHNEIIISNQDATLGYSYVFNLDTKAYHKITKKYTGHMNSTRYAIEQTGTRKLVDMHIEIDSIVSILMQSRPFQLDPVFTHIQRLIFLADAKLLGDSQNLCLSVFGSDDLDTWKCIISAQKKNAAFRQIRTNKAPKSYRDYVILVTGTVRTDTDLSDVIADYSIVSRRLG